MQSIRKLPYFPIRTGEGMTQEPDLIEDIIQKKKEKRFWIIFVFLIILALFLGRLSVYIQYGEWFPAPVEITCNHFIESCGM